MSRQCSVCASTRKDEIESFAKQGVQIWKIVSYLEKQSIQLSASSILRHLNRHTDIDTKGLLQLKKEIDSNAIEDQPIEYIEDTLLLSDAEIKRRKTVRARKQYYGESDAEIDAAFVEEDAELERSRQSSLAVIAGIERVAETNKKNNDAQAAIQKMQEELMVQYMADKEAENGSKEN